MLNNLFDLFFKKHYNQWEIINDLLFNNKKMTMNKILYIIITTLIFCACNNKEGKLLFVEANPENGFNYPYFLFIPDNILKEEVNFIIVQPNNSGFADNDLNRHIEKAERTASNDFYLGNYVAQKLKYPLLVPIFPRSKTNWKIYTHALDRDVILQKNNPLKRIDLQLISMVEDAKFRLKKLDIGISDQFFMTGFSASATFANRFTLIHPDKVLAVAAGGLNGLLSLPLTNIEGKSLNYPLGINDFTLLFNQEFQKTEFINTPQFYFMGTLDENDAVPYDDAFDQNERELIYECLGEEMLPLRWENCQKTYADNGVNTIFKTYKNIGHELSKSTKKVIVDFFSKISKLEVEKKTRNANILYK